MNPIRILLADDHAVVRTGLKTLIESEPDMQVVGEASEGTSAVRLADELHPDIVVLDISMPGLDGVQAVAALRDHCPSAKVLALTLHEEQGYLHAMLKAGATGYALKRGAASELVTAIRTVADGGTYLDPHVIKAAFSDPVPEPPPESQHLSERETVVLRFIAQGFSNKEIGAKLRLSVKTVETYKSRSMEKLGIRSRVEIVRYAAARGWLSEV